MNVSRGSKGQLPDHMHSHNQIYWDFVQNLSHIFDFQKYLKSSEHDQVRKNID